MQNNKNIIIFSHGFGVKKDARGMFTDIVESLKPDKFYMFDYNEVDDEKNQITVRPFSEQVKILHDVINEVKLNNLGGGIDLICHSQGAIIAALTKPVGIRKIIFIAPPSSVNIDRTINYFKTRPDSEINLKGNSKLCRADGSTTLVPSEYWTERENIKLSDLYNGLAKETELILINPTQDERIEKKFFSGLKKTEIIEIDGGHNFEGESRLKLLEVIKGKIL